MICTSDGVTIAIGSKTYSIPTTHQNYRLILDKIKAGKYDEVELLVDVAKHLKHVSDGRFEIAGNDIVYGGRKYSGKLASRTLTMVAEGFDIAPMLRYMENLAANPSMRAVGELYPFMDTCKLPITEDGCFLAYKNVLKSDDPELNFKDHYTKKLDNHPGKVVEMPRNLVNDDPNEECKDGLHFASLAYLPNYHNNTNISHTIVIKINPRDVVSIPKSYTGKGRCCRYEVVGVWMEDAPRDVDAFDKTVVTEQNRKTAAPGVKWVETGGPEASPPQA